MDVPQALAAYGIGEINLAHLPEGELLAKTVAKARDHVEGPRASFIASGSTAERWCPKWVSRDQRPKMDKELGHPFQRGFAQFSTCWWARALTQLAVQGKVQRESITPSMLINQFLVLSRMAQESSIAHAFAYDEMLWDAIRDRLDKGDKKLNLEEMLSETDAKIEAEADKRVKKARTAASSSSTPNASQNPEPKQFPNLKWCAVCKKSGHSIEECRKKIWCSHCKKYGNHESQACFRKGGKGTSKGKSAKDKGQGRK